MGKNEKGLYDGELFIRSKFDVLNDEAEDILASKLGRERAKEIIDNLRTIESMEPLFYEKEISYDGLRIHLGGRSYTGFGLRIWNAERDWFDLKLRTSVTKYTPEEDPFTKIRVAK
ncbi:MAG: hypothetical protein WAO24_08140 [Peptococcia bacterium]